MENISELMCDRINVYRELNGSYTNLIHGYEGIPQNLVLNFVCWVLFMTLFIILRRRAWDHGRIAFVTRNGDRWTQPPHDECESAPSDNMAESTDSLDATFRTRERGLFGWIPAFIKLRDVDIERKCGSDAVQYLSFQRYLLVYSSVLGVLCIVVVLPVNFKGSLKAPDTQQFGITTMSNIAVDSSTLWLHLALSSVFMVLAVVFMRHFSRNLKLDRDERSSRTLMISGIPHHCRDKRTISTHFKEAYVGCNVSDLQFVYNVCNLTKLDKSGQAAADALRQSELVLVQTGQRPRLVPWTCGRLLCCCRDCGFYEVDAINYYRERVARYRGLCRAEREYTGIRPLGILFVTFETEMQAREVMKDYWNSRHFFRGPVAFSSFSFVLHSKRWGVTYAPSPNDLYWESLSARQVVWWMKAVLINLIVFTVIFFLTTPTYVLNLLNKLAYKTRMNQLSLNFIVNMAPSLIMWIVSALLPLVVYYSDQLIGHWTKTSANLSVMIKTFILLILMVLILPSLGLTSIPAFLHWIFPTNTKILGIDHHQGIIQWECVFMPDNGAFFVNYVITSAFFGTGLELLRLPELFLHGCRILFARSQVEKFAVRKLVVWEFQFGQCYAWMLCVFAVMCSYSLPCPLIMPFGILYLTLKHLVDRYNLYFAYTPSRIDKRVHGWATTFMLACVLLLQLNVSAFLALRLDVLNPLNFTGFVISIVALLIFFVRSIFGCFNQCGISDNVNRAYSENIDMNTSPLDRVEEAINVPETPSTITPGNTEDGISEVSIATSPTLKGAYLPPILAEHFHLGSVIGRTAGQSQCTMHGCIDPMDGFELPPNGDDVIMGDTSALVGGGLSNSVFYDLLDFQEDEEF